MIETMKFNVGGKSFEVSRSLLNTIDPHKTDIPNNSEDNCKYSIKEEAYISNDNPLGDHEIKPKKNMLHFYKEGGGGMGS